MKKFTPRYKYGLYTKDWGDARIREEYDVKIEHWLSNFPKDKHPLLLELLKNFYFYSQAKVGEKVKQLHQKLISNHSIDINKTVFTKIPKKAGVGFLILLLWHIGTTMNCMTLMLVTFGI